MGLTDLVLKEMRADGGIVSAYALASLLSAKLHRRIAPNSVYRVLYRLIDQGVVQRLETRNGFVVCTETRGDIVAICSSCDEIIWVDGAAVHDQLHHIAKSARFVPSRHIVEVIGFCSTCSREAEAATGARAAL